MKITIKIHPDIQIKKMNSLFSQKQAHQVIKQMNLHENISQSLRITSFIDKKRIFLKWGVKGVPITGTKREE